MITLYESILGSTNSGTFSKPLDYTTKTYTMKKQYLEKMTDDFCKFYTIEETTSKKDVEEAFTRALEIYDNKIEVVHDKSVYKRLLHALKNKQIHFEHDLDYVPTIYNTDDIPLVIKSHVLYAGKQQTYYWIWHWGSKRDLFTWQNSWLMIYPK